MLTQGWVGLVVTMLGVFSLVPHSVTANTLNPNFTAWSEASTLLQGTSHSTVLFYNDTFISVGGCLSVDCSQQSPAVVQYDPSIPTINGEHQLLDDGTAEFPPLTDPIAGHHTSIVFSGLVYVVRSCSILVNASHSYSSNVVSDGASSPLFRSGRTSDSSAEARKAELLDLYSTVTEYDPITGTVNDTFFTIPLEFVRANASCVNVANFVYLVGGYNISSGRGVLTIDAIDVLNMEFVPNVTMLDFCVSNPTVTTDVSSIFIAGGRLLDHSEGNVADVSRLVWRFVPSSSDDDGSENCLDMLPPLPIDFVDRNSSSTQDLTTSFSVVSFGGYVVVINSDASQGAILPLHFSSNAVWSVFAWNSTAVQSFGPSSDGELPPDEILPGFISGASTGFFATVPSRAGEFAALGRNASASHLIMYRFGGVVWQRKWLTVNTSLVTEVVATNVSLSVATRLLTLPVNNLADRTIQSGLFDFQLVGMNVSEYCGGSIKTTPCRVRLSSRLDCLGRAAGTFDASWAAAHDVVFTPTGASFPVYVCFSYGSSSVDTCGGTRVPPTFFNTDAFHPLDIVSGTPAPVPRTAAPTPPPKSGLGSFATLLYIFGGVAALTTVVAVLLVAKLRKVPDEGLIGGSHHGGAGGSSNPVVGYGTHQEERYKIMGKIGEGAFSVVYLVARRADGVKFAMKHLECQTDLQRQEAIKECEIMRSLQGHPNVINLYDMFMNYEFDTPELPQHTNATRKPQYGQRRKDEQEPLLGASLMEDNGTASSAQHKPSRHLCLVMEYHAAGDLRKWALGHRGTVSEAILCSIAFQVTSVLKHIHSQDPAVIHRDLKPENILIVSMDDHHVAPSALTFLPIVITDFGLARIQETSYCASGAGTLPYVAPECFKKKYTVQCDMWSLGCVLYAVATKRCSHDNVRLMFQDCDQPHFKQSISDDLRRCGLSELFITFTMMLIEPDTDKRLSAHQAFKMFRKRGETIFLSQRVSLGKGGASPSATSPLVRVLQPEDPNDYLDSTIACVSPPSEFEGTCSPNLTSPLLAAANNSGHTAGDASRLPPLSPAAVAQAASTEWPREPTEEQCHHGEQQIEIAPDSQQSINSDAPRT